MHNAVVALCSGTLERGEEISVNEEASFSIDSNCGSSTSTYKIGKWSSINTNRIFYVILNSACAVILPKEFKPFTLTNYREIQDCSIYKGTKIHYQGKDYRLSLDIDAMVLSRYMRWTFNQNGLKLNGEEMILCTSSYPKHEFSVKSVDVSVPEYLKILYAFVDNVKSVDFIVDQEGVSYRILSNSLN